MDRIDCLRAFVRTLEGGSFSAAAKELGIGQPAISKRIALLEEEFGTQLQVRPIVDFGDTPSSVSRGAPTLAKHTNEILAEYGYASDEIERLRSCGAVA